MKISKRGFLRAAIACLFSSESLPADDREITGGMSNGRKWAKLDDTQQVFLLVGIRDGVRHVYDMQLPLLSFDKAINDRLQEEEDLFFSPNTFGEIQTQIGIYYKDPANSILPVADVYFQAVRKFKGASQQAIEEAFTVLRKLYTGGFDTPAPEMQRLPK